jgi:hypothetical protein
MASIVTYDIPSKHAEVKKALFKRGYKDQISGESCEVIYFPNTTVYHSGKTPIQARDDVKIICKNLSVNLERCVATIWSEWAAKCGEPFT